MMSSLYTGVSALSSNQKKIDVISNNIANANTIGYKYQTVSFSDTLYQQVNGATAPSNNVGGINPKQVGLGVTVASMSTVHTMGSLQYTGNATDLAISGEGYFVVKGPDDEFYFTRAGNFGVDSSGNLVTADGYQVCGWQDASVQADGTFIFDTASEPKPINIYESGEGSNQTSAPKVTSSVKLSGNLDAANEAKGDALNDIGEGADGEADFILPTTIYDKLGGEHQVDVEYYKCFVDEATNVSSYYWQSVNEEGEVIGSGYIKFDAEGNIINDDSDFSTEVTVSFDPGENSGTESFDYTMDLSTLTMFGADSSVKTVYVDGNAAGTLTDFSIDANGVVMGVYSNGIQEPLGIISLANFENPSGLMKAGNNMYAATPNSGDFTVGNMAGTGGTGQLSVGTIEMSNVDLSKEYSELILAQRGYQASSSIISTVDELLQELINLKR